MKLAEPEVDPVQKRVSVIKPASYAFTEALDHRTFLLTLRSSLYDGRVVRRMGNWKIALYVAIKSRYFIASDPVTILPFFRTFKSERDIIRVHESAAMWLLPSYLRDPSKETLQSRIYRQGSKALESLTKYCEESSIFWIPTPPTTFWQWPKRV